MSGTDILAFKLSGPTSAMCLDLAPATCLVGWSVAKPHSVGCEEITAVWCSVIKNWGGG
uniref:Uncharacterized protein n=1 Tax=Arundo donax TaxID=35708 RepID=A0A0A9D366_ARUDO